MVQGFHAPVLTPAALRLVPRTVDISIVLVDTASIGIGARLVRQRRRVVNAVAAGVEETRNWRDWAGDPGAAPCCETPSTFRFLVEVNFLK